MFALLNGLAMLVLALLGAITGSTLITGVYALYALGTLVPSIAVGIRRLHDTDRSGWTILLGLIPIVGTIVLLVFLCQDSQAGENRYGSNPKEAAVEALPAL